MTTNETPARPVNEPALVNTSPKDSVILDALEEPLSEGYHFSSHCELPKSDALRQPVVDLDSRLSARLEGWSNGSFSRNIDQFLDLVASLRLKHMPHRGSAWDKMLQQAVMFSSQVHHYEEAVSETLMDSSQAASIIYGCVHALIEVRTCLSFE